jgi:DNA polymerase-1
VVVIAEAPGTQELRVGVPLVGPSGKVFWQTLPKSILDSMGLDPKQEVYILNALQCCPPRTKDAAKNTAKIHQAAQICKPRLMELIAAHPRKLIITMGNHAIHSVTGNHGLKITQVRGTLLPTPYATIGLIPVVHPAALLRGTGNYRQFREDITYAFELLQSNGTSIKRPITPVWEVCLDARDVYAAAYKLLRFDVVAADTETSHLKPQQGHIIGTGLSGDPRHVYIVPEGLEHHLRPFFRTIAERRRRGISAPRIVWHNGKFDMGFIRKDCPDARVDEDTMLLSYCWDESGGIHDLEQVGGDLIGAPDYKAMLKPYLPNKKTSYSVIPKKVLHEYLAYDVSNTLQIFQILRPRIAGDRHLEKLYTRVLLPASEALYKAEIRGMMINLKALERNRKRLEAEIAVEVTNFEEVTTKLGLGRYNPASPIQMQDLLYNKLKLGPIGQSTDAAHLDKLPPHVAVKALQRYRKAAKALSTYVESIEESIQPDGAIHSTYLIHGTRTGRLSSRKPNVQNIPRDLRLRGQFVARPGYVFVKADLNQAELRSLACLSHDDFLLEIYAPGGKRSLHKETAKDFFGPNWDKEQLMRAKAVNFGIVYGRTSNSIAEEFGIPTKEAQKWIDIWFKRSPKARDYIMSCRMAPLRNQTLLTCFGRKKRHWLVTRENIEAMQNEASNFPHQSIASDICLLGGARAQTEFERSGRDIHVVNLVHDEAMFECPDTPQDIDFCRSVLIRNMESIAPEWGLTRVPFKAEADVGKRWGIWRNPKTPQQDFGN